MTEPADVQVVPIDLLADHDPEQDAAAQDWIGVHASVQVELFGEGSSAWTLEEVRELHRSGDKRRIDRAALVDGRLVGALELMLPVNDNRDTALLWLSVDPSSRGRGVGSTLLAEAERVAASEGRGVLRVETEWAAGSTDTAEPFARRHGFEVGQEVLRSEQRLPVDPALLGRLLGPLTDPLTDPLPSGGDGYVVEFFVDTMPEAWYADRVVLQQRMSTDAPADDLDLEEEVWDVERLRRAQQATRASGRRVVESVARHVASGRLVGFTTVTVSASSPDLGYQQDTLVLREHRGHGLGLRLKAANARRVAEALPDVTRIRTWNAASNGPMLDVNRRLGYVVDGHSREWQRAT
ncbi:GNAT family N-acetyltransferase [Terracoccus luteus]|uniref:GNAT superfamily N-acetyltransferase n=1 Tax=Terracoccus luteus TaxID=53356 RepID=A0A839PRG2_9MICO|nr:GNAT family N-acetyltransferase [Terracoccus luteus]MBB2985643.1 GNAT superfamily N-acetyltransferase [Terracoccus luteus]MCP2171295.1 GNAT superfamily N-acetyltransferase [Terracoccus luteus]